MLRNLLRFVLLVLNILSAFFFVGCCASAYISPATLPFLSVVNLGFPLVLAGNVLWVLFWLFWQRKFSFISLVALLLGGFNLLSYFSLFPSKAKLPQGIASYTIMTYNVKNFDLYNWKNNAASKKQIMEVIRGKKPDILCLQEFYSDSSKNFNTLQELLKIYPYYHFWKSLSLDHGRYWGQATFSKYPIVKKELLTFENSKHNLCLVSKIQLGDSVISVYNVHLQSYHFDNHDYAAMEKVGASDTNHRIPLGKWYRKLSEATQQRAVQADILARRIQDDTRPVALCGDFNDSPNSYVYHKVSKGLKDTFLKAGRGVGQTYNGPFPSLRIDYILLNPSFNIMEHQVLHQGTSDHYAVLTKVFF